MFFLFYSKFELGARKLQYCNLKCGRAMCLLASRATRVGILSRERLWFESGAAVAPSPHHPLFPFPAQFSPGRYPPTHYPPTCPPLLEPGSQRAAVENAYKYLDKCIICATLRCASCRSFHVGKCGAKEMKILSIFHFKLTTYGDELAPFTHIFNGVVRYL